MPRLQLGRLMERSNGGYGLKALVTASNWRFDDWTISVNFACCHILERL